jgi:glyoxylase-like metal-dependent hydrolase (beta-lactamase superfamily II)
MFRSGLAVAASVLWAATANAEPQPLLAFNPLPEQDGARLDLARPDIRTIKLADGVYMLESQSGNIGNITVATAKDGLLMVDGGRASFHDRIRAAIATISHLKVKYLVDTQFHADHAGGNEHFARDGAIVIAEVHVRTRLAAGTMDGLTGVRTPPVAARALPARTYTGSVRIRLDSRVADLTHIANAQTDGDTFVWLKTANVLVTGDTFTNGRYPTIDFANGGNIDGLIAAGDTYLKLTDTNSKIVPGHGPVADKAGLLDYYTMLEVARDRMETLIQEGKTEDDVVAERPFADLDAKWADTEQAGKAFVRSLYRSMADKPFPARKPLLRQVLRRN